MDFSSSNLLLPHKTLSTEYYIKFLGIPKVTEVGVLEKYVLPKLGECSGDTLTESQKVKWVQIIWNLIKGDGECVSAIQKAQADILDENYNFAIEALNLKLPKEYNNLLVKMKRTPFLMGKKVNEWTITSKNVF